MQIPTIINAGLYAEARFINFINDFIEFDTKAMENTRRYFNYSSGKLILSKKL